jgi:hypothetical protein
MIEYKKAKSVDELVVIEASDQAMIRHKNCQSKACLCLWLKDFDEMSGDQVLTRFNAYIDEILESIETDRPIEIIAGHPQINWSEECQQWTPEGDVLRCEVGWDRNADSEDGQGAVAIKIDDRMLSGAEFLDVLAVHEGAGMRIEFIHPNRLTNPPKPVLKQRRKEIR